MSTPTPASKEEMQNLHRLLAAEFTSILTQGVKVVDKDTGEVLVLSASPAQLNVIRQFLKDNDITAVLSSKPMKSIVDNLPFGDDDLPPNAVRFPQHG